MYSRHEIRIRLLLILGIFACFGAIALPRLFGFSGGRAVTQRGLIAWVKVGTDQVQKSSEHVPRVETDQKSGLPVLQFDGENDFLELNGITAALSGKAVSELTVIYAASRNRDATQYVWSFHGADQATDILRAGFAPGGRVRLKANTIVGGGYTDAPALSNSGLNVYSVILMRESARLYANGTLLISDALNKPVDVASAKYFSLGQEWDGAQPSDFFGGSLAELVVLKRALSDEERIDWENYLLDRFQIPHGTTFAASGANAGRKPQAPLKERTNFHIIDSDPQGFTLYRSARPDRDAVATWCQLGISEVMVLSGDADNVEKQYQDACPALRVVYNSKHNEEVPVDESFLVQFDEWIAQAKSEQKKVLFRCVAGAHRTGRLGAYYAMKYQNMSLEDATALMIKNGKDMQDRQHLPFQVAALNDYISGKPCRYSAEEAERYCVKPDAN